MLEQALTGMVPRPSTRASVTFNDKNSKSVINNKENVSLNMSHSTAANMSLITSPKPLSTAPSKQALESQRLLAQYRDAKRARRSQSQDLDESLEASSIVTADDYKKHNLFAGSHHYSIDTRTQHDLVSVCDAPPSTQSDHLNNRLASLLRQNHVCKKERNELRFRLDRESQRGIALARENESLRGALELYQEKVTGAELEAHRVLKRLLKRDKLPGLAQALGQVEELVAAQAEELARCQELVGEQARQIESLQAKQYDTCIDMVKKNNQLEAQALKLKGAVEALQEERRALREEQRDAADRLKAALEAKLALEAQLHGAERAQSQQEADASYQLHALRASLAALTEEGERWRREREALQGEAEAMGRARDAFKQQYLELKEANKELRAQFRDLEAKVSSCVSAARAKEDREKLRPV